MFRRSGSRFADKNMRQMKEQMTAMIRAFAVTLTIAAALLCAQIAAAPAQVASSATSLPTLKRAVTVSGDIVRIGDLIENAGSVAEAAIFRAPDIGTTGSVSVQQVLD